MTRRYYSALGRAAFAAVGFGLMTASFAQAADEGSIARGGRIYDKWYAETGQKAPDASHPLYPSSAKYAEKPESNWRCKECHGWDGKGADGVYSKGKHFTGIKGISGMAGADPAAIIAVVTAPEHGFGAYLQAADLADLANFVAYGDYGYDAYVVDGKIVGDVERGRQVYGTICSNCHGSEGKLPKEMPPLASLVSNPWEVMHKLLNGQPHEAMPALRAFDHQISADVIAYIAAELPAE